MGRILLILVLLFLCYLPEGTAGSHGGSTTFNWESKVITSLEEQSFNSTLQQLGPETPALIEFYASWCPACQAFAQHYEKIAEFFEKHKDVGVFVGRVDCAKEVALCPQFNLEWFPSVFFGSADAFIKRDRAHIKLYDRAGQREPADIVGWVGDQINRTLIYTEGKADEDDALIAELGTVSSTAFVANAWTFAVADAELATVQLFEHLLEHLSGSTKRDALKDLLQLWASAHPSPRCLTGAAQLLTELPIIWHPSQSRPMARLMNHKICGAEPMHSRWRGCQGSRNNTRGFTCGAWVMLHACSVRVKEQGGGKLLMAGLRAFINHFFGCADCVQHFQPILTCASAAAVSTRADAVMWLWRAHNEVNAKVGHDEAEHHYGDPMLPKVQWPPRSLCPACHAGPAGNAAGTAIEWKEPEVLAFLINHFAVDKTAAGGAELPPHSTVGTGVLAEPSTRLVLGPAGEVAQPYGLMASSRRLQEVGACLLLLGIGLTFYLLLRRRRSSNGNHRNR